MWLANIGQLDRKGQTHLEELKTEAAKIEKAKKVKREKKRGYVFNFNFFL